LPAPFADDLAAVAASGCTAIEAWLTKLEANASADLPKELADRGLTIPVAAGQGGLLLSTGDARASQWDHFKRRLDLCQRLGIGTMVIAPDNVPSATVDVLGPVADSLGQAAAWAAEFGVRLAFEFQARNAVCASLETVAMLVAAVGSPHLGLCLDAFHFWAGPSLESDLALLTAENLFHVQLCDVAGVPREFARDADRVFPGEGDIPLSPIVARLREIGYAGTVGLELLNPTLWKCKATQVMELGDAAMIRTLG
jgi:4-hydroxyphenylpyruvate dioxygenase